MAFCGNCGNELREGAKFCPKCGTPSGSETKQDTETKQKNSSKKGGLIAVIIVMAVIALGGAAWYFLGNQQDKYSLEGLAKAVVNYDMVSDFHEGLAMVTKGDKYGFIDKMGNEVIPCIYDFMEYTDCSFHEGLAFVRQGDSGYFINKEGKKAFDFKYDAANHFSDGLAIVWKDGKTGYIDTKGNEVIALSDKYAYYDFSEGLAAVGKDGKYGFIDKSGNLVIPINYDDIGEKDGEPYFHEGLSAVCKNEKYGYIDKSGKEVIPFKYTYALDFSEGLAVVKQNDKWGFIDKNGSIVIPCVFDNPAVFSEGYAAVSKDGKYYIIDKNGKEVFSLSAYTTGYGDAIFHEGFAPVFRKIGDSHVCGFVDTSGKEVIPCVYTNWPFFSEGLAVVEKDGIYGFVDKKGNSTFDLQDEEVNRAVQAKIQEKEEARKEAERRAEEERKRIEEENQPHNRFFKIAKQGGSAWVIRSSGQMAFFYPKDKSYGKVSFLILNGNDVLMSSGSTTYTISNNHISFNYQTDVWGKTFYMSFTGEIKNDGEKVKIVGQYSGSTVNGPIEVTLDQVRPLISDPFKK